MNKNNSYYFQNNSYYFQNLSYNFIRLGTYRELAATRTCHDRPLAPLRQGPCGKRITCKSPAKAFIKKRVWPCHLDKRPHPYNTKIKYLQTLIDEKTSNPPPLSPGRRDKSLNVGRTMMLQIGIHCHVYGLLMGHLQVTFNSITGCRPIFTTHSPALLA